MERFTEQTFRASRNGAAIVSTEFVFELDKKDTASFFKRMNTISRHEEIIIHVPYSLGHKIKWHTTTGYSSKKITRIMNREKNKFKHQGVFFGLEYAELPAP